MKLRFKSLVCIVALILAVCFAFSGCNLIEGFNGFTEGVDSKQTDATQQLTPPSDAEDPICRQLGISPFKGERYAAVNGNVPNFTKSEITAESYEFYSELDSLGRCGYAMACLGQDLMPTGDRGDIGSVKPSGWVQKNYGSDIVSGGLLYNRSHLIAWSLAGENANVKNLITGTAYMNQGTMTIFEDMVRDYIKETGNHVMYRITPMFYSNELVARGVLMEAYSVEDDGEEISFNVYVYNVQPGVEINYATGESKLAGAEDSPSEENTDAVNEENAKYVLNTKSKVIHSPTCSSVASTSEKNKKFSNESLDTLISQGYTKCGICNADT